MSDDLRAAKEFAWEMGACNAWFKAGRTLDECLAENPHKKEEEKKK